MPVQKFKSHEEAREALWADSHDIARRLRNLLAATERLTVRVQQAPRGVTKFRDIESAGAARDSVASEFCRNIATSAT